ncbi:MAG: VOC family protein [Proteobacteria bacterium]|nr:VOC family protein [Pseudomonadota bacterium]
MEVIGLDHVYLSVSDLARSERFYDPVMQALGFRKGDKPIAGEPHAHYFNRVLQLTLRPARSAGPHDPYAPGLHHLCLQLATPADVDAAAGALRQLGVAATDPARYPEYNPDYYATFFSDPDGLRLELVSRTPYRDEVVKYWDRFTTFLNPWAEFKARRR